MLASLCSTLADVALFWRSVCASQYHLIIQFANSRFILIVLLYQKAFSWWTKRKPRDVLLDNLGQARSYEDWEEAALKLDELFGSDLWYAHLSGLLIRASSYID